MNLFGEINSAGIALKMKYKCDSRSSVTYLLWHQKTSGRTTINNLLDRLECRAGREILKYVPPEDSQSFYKEKGLKNPLAEIVLKSANPQEIISRIESTNMYWLLEKRGFKVFSYTFNDEGERIIENISPGL